MSSVKKSPIQKFCRRVFYFPCRFEAASRALAARPALTVTSSAGRGQPVHPSLPMHPPPAFVGRDAGRETSTANAGAGGRLLPRPTPAPCAAARQTPSRCSRP